MTCRGGGGGGEGESRGGERGLDRRLRPLAPVRSRARAPEHTCAASPFYTSLLPPGAARHTINAPPATASPGGHHETARRPTTARARSDVTQQRRRRTPDCARGFAALGQPQGKGCRAAAWRAQGASHRRESWLCRGPLPAPRPPGSRDGASSRTTARVPDRLGGKSSPRVPCAPPGLARRRRRSRKRRPWGLEWWSRGVMAASVAGTRNPWPTARALAPAARHGTWAPLGHRRAARPGLLSARPRAALHESPAAASQRPPPHSYRRHQSPRASKGTPRAAFYAAVPAYGSLYGPGSCTIARRPARRPFRLAGRPRNVATARPTTARGAVAALSQVCCSLVLLQRCNALRQLRPSQDPMSCSRRRPRASSACRRPPSKGLAAKNRLGRVSPVAGVFACLTSTTDTARARPRGSCSRRKRRKQRWVLFGKPWPPSS